MVVGTVQEEDCDGLCWQYIINEDKIRPEFVVSTEPTDGGIYRGQRGRMEIRVDVKGVSCMVLLRNVVTTPSTKWPISSRTSALSTKTATAPPMRSRARENADPEFNPEHAEDAQFLGRGTCTVSQIFYTSPSRCAVADSCAISVDRRMTAGETWDSCLKEIELCPPSRSIRTM